MSSGPPPGGNHHRQGRQAYGQAYAAEVQGIGVSLNKRTQCELERPLDAAV